MNFCGDETTRNSVDGSVNQGKTAQVLSKQAVDDKVFCFNRNSPLPRNHPDTRSRSRNRQVLRTALTEGRLVPVHHGVWCCSDTDMTPANWLTIYVWPRKFQITQRHRPLPDSEQCFAPVGPESAPSLDVHLNFKWQNRVSSIFLSFFVYMSWFQAPFMVKLKAFFFFVSDEDVKECCETDWIASASKQFFCRSWPHAWFASFPCSHTDRCLCHYLSNSLTLEDFDNPWRLLHQLTLKTMAVGNSLSHI